jgi:hypothetical protein
MPTRASTTAKNNENEGAENRIAPNYNKKPFGKIYLLRRQREKNKIFHF